MAAAQPELAVDEVVDPVGQVGDDLCLLCLGEAPVLDGLLEVGLRSRDQGVLEPIDGLVLLLGDLGERGALAEARAERLLGDAEVVRRCVSPSAIRSFISAP
jgi:hypothetical protein